MAVLWVGHSSTLCLRVLKTEAVLFRLYVGAPAFWKPADVFSGKLLLLAVADIDIRTMMGIHMVHVSSILLVGGLAVLVT